VGATSTNRGEVDTHLRSKLFGPGAGDDATVVHHRGRCSPQERQRVLALAQETALVPEPLLVWELAWVWVQGLLRPQELLAHWLWRLQSQPRFQRLSRWFRPLVPSCQPASEPRPESRPETTQRPCRPYPTPPPALIHHGQPCPQAVSATPRSCPPSWWS